MCNGGYHRNPLDLLFDFNNFVSAAFAMVKSPDSQM